MKPDQTRGPSLCARLEFVRRRTWDLPPRDQSRSVIAVGAAVIVGTTGALVLPAVASAHNASTTLKFTAVTKARVTFTKTTFGLQETDVNSKGKTIGVR